MTYKVSKIEDLKKTLLDLPDIDRSKLEVNKKEAIKMMSSEIEKLKKRGYSIDIIADILTNNGVDIRVSTLKSYLNKVKTKSSKKKRQNTKEINQSSIPLMVTSEINISAKKINSKNDDSINESGNGTFAIREDSDDI